MKLAKIFAILLTMFITSVHALSLQEAKSNGLVIEKPTGYLEAKSSKPEVIKLVKEVNTGRKAEYIKIAKKRNLSVEEVAKIAAAQIKKRDRMKKN